MAGVAGGDGEGVIVGDGVAVGSGVAVGDGVNVGDEVAVGDGSITAVSATIFEAVATATAVTVASASPAVQAVESNIPNRSKKKIEQDIFIRIPSPSRAVLGKKKRPERLNSGRSNAVMLLAYSLVNVTAPTSVGAPERTGISSEPMP